MPVELSHFTARSISSSTHLTWATATETNNSHFEVQRSADGRKWEVLGEVKGAGTIQEPQQYEFTDDRPPVGLSYYRLRQVDYDGQYEYSPVVTANRKGGAFPFSVFPNPAGESVSLVLPGGAEGLRAELYDARGRQVLRQQLAAESGRVEIGLTSLPPGLYYLSIRDGQGKQLGVQRIAKR